MSEYFEWERGKREQDAFILLVSHPQICLFLKSFECITQSHPKVKLELPRGHVENIVPPLVPVLLLLLHLKSLPIPNVYALTWRFTIL